MKRFAMKPLVLLLSAALTGSAVDLAHVPAHYFDSGISK